MRNIDWKNPFKPKDFRELSKAYDLFTAKWAMALANKRFRELMEQCPVRYAWTLPVPNQHGIVESLWGQDPGTGVPGCTFVSARLICIEEIKK